MDQVLNLIRQNLPQPAYESLQLVVSSLPDAFQQQVEQLPPSVQPLLSTPEGLVVLLSLLVLLLTFIVVTISSPKNKGVKSIVLAGPSNAGKTTLFFQLRDGSTHNGVVASMQENAATCTLQLGKAGQGRTVRLVDVPGHASMRDKLSAQLKEASGVVFLVDAVEITPHRTEAAELLYDILTDSSFQRRRTPVLIACNKMDLELDAHSVDFIRKTLEKQLDTMRRTKTAGIGKQAAAGKPALGTLDKPFSLAAYAGSKVTLVEVSAKQQMLQPIEAFIAQCL